MRDLFASKMRVIFAKGKQKELLVSYKKRHKLSWLDVCNKLGVKFSALHDWSYEKNSLPLDVFEKMGGSDYRKFILEIREENWGRVMGGKNSVGSLKQLVSPPKNADLAELIGVILGDGNLGYYKKGKKIGTYALKIGGHILEDRKYLEIYVASLIRKLFNTKPRFFIQRNGPEFFVVIYSKKIIGFLEAMGLKTGNKKVNNVGIPKWIMSNKQFTVRCLRGLIDTDGSIYRMSNQDSGLLRLQFTNASKKLLFDARKLFVKLGYSPNNVVGNSFRLSIQREIYRYIKEIGFGNPKHLKRIRQFTEFTAP